MTTFKTNILHYHDLDICCCCSRSMNICYDYWTAINGGREPKFSISNKILQRCCQCYLALLESFIFVKKAVITIEYPVIIILKLRPNNSFNLGSYRRVCRHSILLSQNLGTLLTLMPSVTTPCGQCCESNIGR